MQTDPQPYPLRGCYLCGKKVQVKIKDPFLLEVHADGRSFNYCTPHLLVLQKYAPLPYIDKHRRLLLPASRDKKYGITKIIRDLQGMIEYPTP